MPYTMMLELRQKAVRTMRACFAIAPDTQMKHGGFKSKVFSWTIMWWWKLMLKVSYGISLEIGLIKRMVQWKIWTACTVITAYKNLSQHFECLVKMRATSSTLFVHVNTGVTENAEIENARRSKCDIGKPETDTHYRSQRLTKTYDTYFRSL